MLVLRFECPVFIHNAVNIRRHNATLADRAKFLVSWRTRKRARREVNRQLVELVGQVRQVGYDYLHVFDEESILGEEPEWNLGRRYYDSKKQHPTVFSHRVAGQYLDLINAHVTLRGKKLVVCDLDNTLWDGEIGEGEVQHHADRQGILKRLRQKGIVLAINSKNDPRNVHWRGAVLGEDDFVASQINWDSKIVNMRRLEQTLNLKLKDYVFLDDRADQRALVSSALPEILAMDATSERTWRLLDVWARGLPDQLEADRTQLYRERKQREQFLSAEPSEAEDSLLAGLELQATVRRAKKSDLKRVVELINRTNQFNLNASRTSLLEMTEWLAVPGHNLLHADGADKFGQMGTVCVAATEQDGATVRILTFVLSCRAFGYGFETAMLRAIQRLARASAPYGEPPRIVGLYQETALNSTSRSMYPDHGFTWDGSAWVHQAHTPIEPPAWLKVSEVLSA